MTLKVSNVKIMFTFFKQTKSTYLLYWFSGRDQHAFHLRIIADHAILTSNEVLKNTPYLYI